MGLADQLATGLGKRRAELGLTLREVAIEAGVSLPYVANLEKGRGNPTLDVIESLAAALEISVATLLFAESAVEPRPALQTLSPAAVRYARSRHFRSVAERIARQQRVPVEETRRRILGAIAAAPRARGRQLSQADCRRLIDAFILIVTEPDEPA